MLALKQGKVKKIDMGKYDAQTRYQRGKFKTFTLKLYKEQQPDIVEHMENIEAHTGLTANAYLKQLVIADMQKTPSNAPRTPETVATCDTCKTQDCDRRRPKQAKCGEYEE